MSTQKIPNIIVAVIFIVLNFNFTSLWSKMRLWLNMQMKWLWDTMLPTERISPFPPWGHSPYPTHNHHKAPRMLSKFRWSATPAAAKLTEHLMIWINNKHPRVSTRNPSPAKMVKHPKEFCSWSSLSSNMLGARNQEWCQEFPALACVGLRDPKSG